jgi:hypothetical protein
MTGETDRLMTDTAQAELVCHVVTMASNLHKRKLGYTWCKQNAIHRQGACMC